MKSEKERNIAIEACNAYRDQLDLKPGDTVKVMFKVPSEACGWRSLWTDDKDEFIGKEAKVTELCPDGDSVKLVYEGDYCYFPAFCLEVVSRKVDEKTITIEGREFSESTIKAALKKYACWE